MSDRVGAAERFWLIVFGLGIVWLALTGAMSVGQYPSGSLRNEPLYWVVASGFGLVLGGLAVASGLLGGPRRRRRGITIETGARLARLRQPIEYSRHVDRPPAVVQQRLQGAISRGATIPARSPAGSRQNFAGSIDGGRVTLLLYDAAIQTRLRSWNVAFIGVIAPDGDGTLVRGTVDIPDRRRLDRLVLVVRIASVAALLIVGALAVRGWVTFGTVSIATVLPVVLGASVAILIPIWYQREGETAAASDAGLIIQFLDNIPVSTDLEQRDRPSS